MPEQLLQNIVTFIETEPLLTLLAAFGLSLYLVIADDKVIRIQLFNGQTTALAGVIAVAASLNYWIQVAGVEALVLDVSSFLIGVAIISPFALTLLKGRINQ